jgi:hypothetical protein
MILGGGRILGGGAFGGGDCSSVVFWLGIFWFCVGSSAVLVNHCRGHRVAGGFGHGGQDSFRFPGAREPDRLLLAGWEVSRFGQSWSVHQARQGKQGKDNHIDGN